MIPIGAAVALMPTAMPAITFVPWPVTDACAICLADRGRGALLPLCQEAEGAKWPRRHSPTHHGNITSLPPPPRRENITNMIRPEDYYVILGGSYSKIRNYQDINSPRIISRNWRLQRPQALPCYFLRN